MVQHLLLAAVGVLEAHPVVTQTSGRAEAMAVAAVAGPVATFLTVAAALFALSGVLIVHSPQQIQVICNGTFYPRC